MDLIKRQAIKEKLFQAFQDWNEESLLLDTKIEDFMHTLEVRGLKIVEIEGRQHTGCNHRTYEDTAGIHCYKCGESFLT